MVPPARASPCGWQPASASLPPPAPPRPRRRHITTPPVASPAPCRRVLLSEVSPEPRAARRLHHVGREEGRERAHQPEGAGAGQRHRTVQNQEAHAAAETHERLLRPSPNTAQYAHYVFNTLDQDRSGLLSFEEFVTGLSILSRGTLEEKLRWTFSLYDINGDGYITKDEMTDIVSAIYDLMGRIVDSNADDEAVRGKVDRLFQKMDVNQDGVVTMEEFLDCCLKDEEMSRSMGVFDSCF